jgi:TonB family protein
MPGVCQAVREYASGSRVFVTDYGPEGASIGVVNRAWSIQTSTPYGLRLVQGGVRQVFAANARPFGHGPGVSADDGDRFLAQLEAGGLLEVTGPEGILLERLDLGGLAPALAPLERCTRETATAAYVPPAATPPPAPPPGKAGTGRPLGQLPSLFSSADYPASAIRAGEEGAVGFRLDIGKDGRVAACTVTASSGSPALDSTTCRLITQRARFLPARDRQGWPTGDIASGKIVWRLPKPPPPLPPPPTP